MFDVRLDLRGHLGPGACAEFPNDNPALHRGAIWRCDETRGPITCELRGVGVRVGAGAGVESRVPLLEFDEEVREHQPGPTTQAAEMADDAFATLVRILEEVARAAGGHEDIPSVLRAVLGETRMPSASLSATAIETLVAGHCLEQGATGIRRTDLLTRTVRAWQGVLRGDSDDFAACGSATLDEWAADVLAGCMGSCALAPVLRRELRKRGVAAFGLVAHAA